MITSTLLCIAVLFFISSSIIAFHLVKKTQFNIAWIFFASAFILLSIITIFTIFQEELESFRFFGILFNITIVLSSLLIFVGIFMIDKLFNYLKVKNERQMVAEEHILNTIIQTEEKERRRFARELHDGVGPLLSSIKMSLSSLDMSGIDKKNYAIIENLTLVANEAISSAREIAQNLNSHILDNFGLNSAIISFIKPINANQKINIQYSSNLEDIRLIYNVEIVVYRVICELINNSLKHSQATKINISLNKHKQLLTLEYTDNGIGFDVDEVLSSQKSNMGISNIYTRIKSLKGIINIDSELGSGEKVIIVLNLSKIPN